MKKTFFIAFCLTIFCITTAQAQLAALNMPANTEDWSKPQTFTLKAADGTTQNVEITTRFVNHRGTTGYMDVKIINYVKDIVRMYVSLINGQVDASTYKGISYNNSTLYSIKNGFNTTFKLQLRECLPKGAGKMTDLEKCKACNPWLAIAEIAFK
ncbi:hypothetical protein [Flavobacterium sp. 3HN19-14]|uniref:hypothetical protein n=1 Tax=Flavobacterium sp. 3HN19-14 TaxID=3448133 RepID=UPI003EE0996C